MNCPTCREQMANAATADARAHLAGCPHCAAWWAEHLAKRALAPAAVRDWAPSPAAVDRALATLPAPGQPIWVTLPATAPLATEPRAPRTWWQRLLGSSFNGVLWRLVVVTAVGLLLAPPDHQFARDVRAFWWRATGANALLLEQEMLEHAERSNTPAAWIAAARVRPLRPDGRDWPDAWECFDRALAAGADREGLLLLRAARYSVGAGGLTGRRRGDAAVEAVRAYPDNAYAWYRLASHYWHENRANDAMIALAHGNRAPRMVGGRAMEVSALDDTRPALRWSGDLAAALRPTYSTDDWPWLQKPWTMPLHSSPGMARQTELIVAATRLAGSPESAEVVGYFNNLPSVTSHQLAPTSGGPEEDVAALVELLTAEADLARQTGRGEAADWLAARAAEWRKDQPAASVMLHTLVANVHQMIRALMVTASALAAALLLLLAAGLTFGQRRAGGEPWPARAVLGSWLLTVLPAAVLLGMVAARDATPGADLLSADKAWPLALSAASLPVLTAALLLRLRHVRAADAHQTLRHTARGLLLPTAALCLLLSMATVPASRHWAGQAEAASVLNNPPPAAHATTPPADWPLGAQLHRPREVADVKLGDRP